MWGTYRDTLREVGDRWVIVALSLLALGVGLLFNMRFTFGEINGVPVILQMGRNMGPWPFAVPAVLGQLAGVTGVLWLIFMLFVGCPMFVQSMEKGWRELTFAKGTPRWHILLGRYMASITLFILLVFISDFPLAARFWWQTGIATWPLLVGILIQTFTFASFLAIGALVAMTGEHVAPPLLVPIGMAMLAELLLNRAALYEEYITWPLAQFFMDWAYYILPKTVELHNAATTFITSSTLPTAWPVWTTGVFILGSLALALWALERKSF